MTSLTGILLILLVVIAVAALVRMMGGGRRAYVAPDRPVSTQRVVEREVERPPSTSGRIVEREVIEDDGAGPNLP